MTRNHYIIAAAVIGLAVLMTVFDLLTATPGPADTAHAKPAETVIREYYGALAAKDAKSAQALLSPELQVLLPEAAVAQGAAALEKIEITGIRKTAEGEGIVVYETTFDAAPKTGMQTSFKEGKNTRHIVLVDIGSEWRISKIATAPVDIGDRKNTQQVLPNQMNGLGNGGTYEFLKGAEISLLLNESLSPRSSVAVACTPARVLSAGSAIASVGAPFYGIKYRAENPGTCEVSAENFRTKVTIN